MRRVFDFLRLDDIPLMTRGNYTAELQQMMLWGIVAGTVEGSMVSVVASKTFQASDLLTTIIWALPILMNLLNVGWATVLRGRPRKPAFFVIASAGLVGIASVGLTSAAWKPWAGWIFAAQVAGTHLFLSGLITLRTTMWKVNYPVTHRARIAGRLQTLRMLLSVLTSGALALLYNYEPESYRLIYPAVALIGACSLWPLRRLRMRGEAAELRGFREHVARTNGGNARPRIGIWAGMREAGGILRTDRLFARYMLAQFLLGAANFYTDPILVNALTKDLKFNYFSAQSILYLIPMTMLLISIRFWATYFDRIGVLRFRIYNSACWVLSYATIASGMLILQIGGHDLLVVTVPIIIIGRVFNGLGRGGGAIAWNLGHLHFAREHQTELYMGIHVGLTGVRALLMPLLGLAAQERFGYAALLLAVLFSGAAHLMFRRLAATSSPARPDQAPPKDEERSH